jgi:hypothetical protein
MIKKKTIILADNTRPNTVWAHRFPQKLRMKKARIAKTGNKSFMTTSS